jgi:hypothetical protein
VVHIVTTLVSAVLLGAGVVRSVRLVRG